MVYRYGHSPYRYGHPGYRHGIWANDMEDDSIDMVILYIDMGYLVTLATPSVSPKDVPKMRWQCGRVSASGSRPPT
jgi:hypothetical protein